MVQPSARDNLHSRVVVILKITLPLVALAVLSSLFLFSRPIDPEDAIPYVDVEIADRLAQPRMTGAGFSTVTADGSTLTLNAAEAAPQAGGATVTGLTGLLASADGATADISAAAGVLDRARATLSLMDGVKMNTSTGYQIVTDALVIATDRTWLESPGAVEATAPFGILNSGAMRLDQDADSKAYHLVFTDGVRLIYQPKN